MRGCGGESSDREGGAQRWATDATVREVLGLGMRRRRSTLDVEADEGCYKGRDEERERRMTDVEHWAGRRGKGGGSDVRVAKAEEALNVGRRADDGRDDEDQLPDVEHRAGRTGAVVVM